MRFVWFARIWGEKKQKKEKKYGTSFFKRRLNQALFLSMGLPLVSASVFALSPEADGVAISDHTGSRESEDQGKDLCRVFLDQEFWDSFGSAERNMSEKDHLADCRDIVAGKDLASEETDLEREIRKMTEGFPIESMASEIAKFDREIAALLVGIAKKESAWGTRVPLDSEGRDCFNYWGYKSSGSRGTAMGHACFGSSEEAVQTVGNRLVKLVSLRETSDPEKMIVWKCGSSCSGHSPESVRKWISDVDLYYRKIAKL